jgi:hypothetical protein
MPYGIGAGGFLGIALEVLPPPVQAATVPSGVGGTLATGTYRYTITAVNALGETIRSNEQSAAVTGPTGSVALSWAAVTGATAYRIYRTAAGGASDTELFLAQVTAPTVIYTDDGSIVPSGAFPTANTAYNPGVYTATGMKFVPITQEGMQMMEETVFRRPIRESADVIGAVPGNQHAEGDIDMEALEDCLPYFLAIARATCVKSGSSPNFIYTYTPNARAVPLLTATIVVMRAEQVFAYTGCVVSMFKFGVQDGLLTFGIHVIARGESTQSAPATSWGSTAPFGAGTYTIEIPTGSVVTDADQFEFTVEDNGEVQYRLKSTSRDGEFVKFGERDVTCTMGRDFTSKTDYDAFKGVTAQSITLEVSKGANNAIELLAPVTVKESYEVPLSGQGDLVRGNITYRSMLGSPSTYQLVVKTQEDLPV